MAGLILQSLFATSDIPARKFRHGQFTYCEPGIHVPLAKLRLSRARVPLGPADQVISLRRKLFLILTLVIIGLNCSSLGAAPKQLHVSGAWNISWQARVGMERGKIQLLQKGSHLTGTYQGRGKPASLSGNFQDGNVSFNLEFQANPPYTIVFTGKVEGDSMTGKFELQGFKDPYDQHGENVQSIDYSWTASRLHDPQKHPNQEQKPAR